MVLYYTIADRRNYFRCAYTVITQNKNYSKKTGNIISFIISCIISSVLALVPFENCFVTFSSPEAAFKYETIGDMGACINGEKSSMILYTHHEAMAVSILPKNKSGWKLGTYFTYRKVLDKFIGTLVVSIFNFDNSKDYYVMVYDTSESKNILCVSDNKSSSFEHYSRYGIASYVAYVKKYDNNYSLKVGDNVINIEKLIAFK